MTKDYLILKSSDQKGSKEYEYYRTLNIENDSIDENSFNQFIELENEDKNIAFFIGDEIKFLSFANSKKFSKSFLKTYKENINNEDINIYVLIRDNKLKESLAEVIESDNRVIELDKENKKTK